MTFEESKNILLDCIDKQPDLDRDAPYVITGDIARSLNDIKKELLNETQFAKDLIENNRKNQERMNESKIRNRNRS